MSNIAACLFDLSPPFNVVVMKTSVLLLIFFGFSLYSCSTAHFKENESTEKVRAIISDIITSNIGCYSEQGICPGDSIALPEKLHADSCIIYLYADGVPPDKRTSYATTIISSQYRHIFNDPGYFNEAASTLDEVLVIDGLRFQIMWSERVPKEVKNYTVIWALVTIDDKTAIHTEATPLQLGTTQIEILYKDYYQK